MLSSPGGESPTAFFNIWCGYAHRWFLFLNQIPTLRRACALPHREMYQVARLSHGRIQRLSGVVLSITVRSQYADPNGTPWETGSSEVWFHQLWLELFNPLDIFHQFLDRLIVFRPDIRGVRSRSSSWSRQILHLRYNRRLHSVIVIRRPPPENGCWESDSLKSILFWYTSSNISQSLGCFCDLSGVQF